jgi:hypothetical protein
MVEVTCERLANVMYSLVLQIIIYYCCMSKLVMSRSRITLCLFVGEGGRTKTDMQKAALSMAQNKSPQPQFNFQ